jgi:hypothetical protein
MLGNAPTPTTGTPISANTASPSIPRRSQSSLSNTVQNQQGTGSPHGSSMTPTSCVKTVSSHILDENERILASPTPPQLVRDLTKTQRSLSSSASTGQLTSQISQKKSKFHDFVFGRKKTSESKISNGSGSNVFGVPLEQAVAFSRIQDMYELPAIVYRCIAYLDSREGICKQRLMF